MLVPSEDITGKSNNKGKEENHELSVAERPSDSFSDDATNSLMELVNKSSRNPKHFCHIISCVWLAVQNFKKSKALINYKDYLDPGALVIPVIRDDEVIQFRLNAKAAEEMLTERKPALLDFIEALKPDAYYHFDSQKDKRFTVRDVNAHVFVIPSFYAKEFANEFLKKYGDIAQILSVIGGDLEHYIKLCNRIENKIDEKIDGVQYPPNMLPLDLFSTEEIEIVKAHHCLRFLPYAASFRYNLVEFFLARKYCLGNEIDYKREVCDEYRVKSMHKLLRFRIRLNHDAIKKISEQCPYHVSNNSNRRLVDTMRS